MKTSALTFIGVEISTLSTFTSLRFPNHVIFEWGVNSSLQVRTDSFPSLSITLTAKYNLLPFTSPSIVASVFSTVFTSVFKLPLKLE